MPGEVRRPRGRLLFDGKEARGLVGFEVDTNNFYEASSWRVTLALSAQPKETSWAFWASTEKARVEIQAGLDDLETLIVGDLDLCVVDPIRDEVRLEGRDLSAGLIDNRTIQKFLNLRTHRLAEQLAEQRGLKAVVTASKTLVGSFFNEDHSALTATSSEWDLLTYVAQHDGKRVWVEGDTLYFVDEDQVPASVFSVRWQGHPAVLEYDVFRFERNLILAKDITVKIESWDAEEKGRIVKTAKAQHSSGRGDGQTFSFTMPGLSREQALRRAQAKLQELSSHEIRLYLGGPAQPGLKQSSTIRVSGTGTAFDQDYFPDQIVRAWDFESGYRWQIRAKNHTPISTVML